MSNPLTWTVGNMPGGLIPSTVRRVQQPKSPTDLIPVTGDFRSTLASIDCDRLNTTFLPLTAVIRNDAGIVDLFVVGTPFISTDATRVTVWLGGGSINYEYLISITVMSIDGQELTRSFIMPVAVR
jgi:hypothetical protein